MITFYSVHTSCVSLSFVCVIICKHKELVHQYRLKLSGLIVHDALFFMYIIFKDKVVTMLLYIYVD